MFTITIHDDGKHESDSITLSVIDQQDGDYYEISSPSDLVAMGKDFNKAFEGLVELIDRQIKELQAFRDNIVNAPKIEVDCFGRPIGQ